MDRTALSSLNLPPTHPLHHFTTPRVHTTLSHTRKRGMLPLTSIFRGGWKIGRRVTSVLLWNLGVKYFSARERLSHYDLRSQKQWPEISGIKSTKVFVFERLRGYPIPKEKQFPHATTISKKIVSSKYIETRQSWNVCLAGCITAPENWAWTEKKQFFQESCSMLLMIGKIEWGKTKAVSNNSKGAF